MPTPKNKYDREHLLRLKRIERQIDEIYKSAIARAAAIGAGISGFDSSRPFRFEDYPLAQMQFNELLKEFEAAQEVCIVNGVDSEWTLANNKNNELANMVFGDKIGKLTQAQYRRYFSTNDAAREAFLKRKDNGLNLSDRVWKYSDMFKNEIEMGLDLGIRGGLSADRMTKELGQYLQHPDMLFRRVRDEHGILHLSKNAAAFHPGRGVYRSSYMNARRLAATEANIAYDLADYERRQQLDFVVGIEVHLSNNHTCKGRDGKPHPFYDICDELQGKYPKDFKFVPWHPHCRCFTTSILKSDKEIAEDLRKIEAGEPLDGESVNAVTEVPDNFKDWLAENEERSKTHFSMPYFIKENPKYISETFRNAYGMKLPYDGNLEAYEYAMRYNKAHPLDTALKTNIRELNEALPVVQGKVMNFTEADGRKINPDYYLSDSRELGYVHNCQTCTMTYELRRRGFDVEAKPNPLVSGYQNYREFSQFAARNNMKWTDRFLNPDGSTVSYEESSLAHITNTISAKRVFINGKTAAQGRYEVYCKWKSEGAHVFIVERTKDSDLIWYDPQTGNKGKEVEAYLKEMKADGIKILRIDDKIINPKFAGRLLKARQ